MVKAASALCSSMTVPLMKYRLSLVFEAVARYLLKKERQAKVDFRLLVCVYFFIS